MTIEDAEHYTPVQRKAIIASYPAHEQEAGRWASWTWGRPHLPDR